MENEDLEKYLEYLKFNKNYSENTLLNYKKDIEEYLNFLKTECLSAYDIKYSDIRFLLDYYQKNNLKSTSIRRKISSLKGFYKYLGRNGKVLDNPFNYVTLPKKEKKITTIS